MNIETMQCENPKLQRLLDVIGILDHYKVTGVFGDDGSIVFILANDEVVHPAHVHLLNTMYGTFNQTEPSSWEVHLD
jgi:hypothetical protein